MKPSLYYGDDCTAEAGESQALKSTATEAAQAKMIESLVEQAPARLRHRRAPLPRERESYLAHLLKRGTSHKRARSIAGYLIHIVRLLRLTHLRGVDLQEIDRAAKRWAAYKGPHRRKKAGPSAADCFAREARNWLRFHGNLTIPVVATHPSDMIVRDFSADPIRAITSGLPTIRKLAADSSRHEWPVSW